MGLVRILLALSVVSGHANLHPAFRMVGGEVAVESFFIISGFYVALIYKKNYENSMQFWKSRYLRLFPIYAVCAIISFFLREDAYLRTLVRLPLGAASFIGLTNLTMFFQDFTMFLGVNGTAFHWTRHFADSQPPLYELLMIPQGWSLGIEISFYLLAPFLLKTQRRMVAGILASIILRLILAALGFQGDPWSYRFLPSELCLFLIGSYAYFYSKDWLLVKWGAGQKWMALTVLFAAILLFPFFHFNPTLKKVIFYILLTLNISNLFELTRDSRFDAFIGMMSYPIYCCHVFVMDKLMQRLPFSWEKGPSFAGAIELWSVVILIAFCLYWIVERPVDAYRMRFKRNDSARRQEASA